MWLKHVISCHESKNVQVISTLKDLISFFRGFTFKENFKIACGYKNGKKKEKKTFII